MLAMARLVIAIPVAERGSSPRQRQP